MFSGGQTSQVGKEQITPEQLQLLESMSVLDEELSKAIKCEPVGQPEEGEEPADPSMVGTSCVASAEQYQAHKDTLFKDAQCNALPGEEAYSCFIPESQTAKTSTENSAKRFKELKKNEDQTWDFVKFGLENAALCGLGGVIGCGIAAWRIGAAVYDSFEYEETPTDGTIVTEGEKAEGAEDTSADAGVSDTEGAKAADKGKKVDENADKQTWDGSLVIDVAGTFAVKYISGLTDVEHQLKEESEQYGAKQTSKAIRKDMVKFARDTAKQIAGPGERVIWDMGAFEYAYNVYAKMEKDGKDSINPKAFEKIGWAKVIYAGDQKQEMVNVFTGEKKPIKKAKPADTNAASGDKNAAEVDNKTKVGGKAKVGGGKNAKGGKKSGSKKASHGIEGF
jgi:hypothetical protein